MTEDYVYPELLHNKTWHMYHISNTDLFEQTKKQFDNYDQLLTAHLESEMRIEYSLNSTPVHVKFMKQPASGSKTLLFVTQSGPLVVAVISGEENILLMYVTRSNVGVYCLDWFRERFDVHFHHVSLPPHQMWLLAENLVTVDFDTEDRKKISGKPLELIFQFPTYIEGLETVSLTFKRREIYDLVTGCQDVQLVDTLKEQFCRQFKIDLKHLNLIRVGTNVALVSNDGRLKIFQKPTKVLEVVTTMLTNQ